ncbi:MAG TPA: response regulator transcription factor [Candidatus Saccharimonadales bacterium]|jgi:DNA-binding NarL/FixJ family response regulator|nr:response regulator transcription factor [Candidatus Saccharimonadales bacterium]
MVIKVSIVEDDSRARQAMEEILNGTPGFKCGGTHANAQHALTHLPIEKPDVVLMDLGLPDLSGVECIRALKKARPELLVMVLTVHEEPQKILEALQAGASGYLLKRTPPARILEALTELASGGSPMTPGVARKVIQHFHNLPRSAERLDQLTDRELEVLHEMAQGSSNKEVATQLKISPETVRNHIRSIFDKLHVHSRTEAVVKYLAKP